MDYQIIQPREIEHIRKNRGAVMIDVREPEAYQQYHFPGARNFPYDSIEGWMQRLPRRRAMILYCDYGSTSLLAARKLGKAGYEVYTVVGGIEAMKRFISIDREF
ncbi:MAG: rhodanese-like domain-containing protein [Clostridiales bacterium]|nr:rhodanese-like domain-containing protein [Roseburia sp.]MDD7637364.1 rhodanese-like domain-containing protein [Clostridiales bacterium]MDY4114046.1 rhodanese-like domain-containing protein [Roseburia sp.]